jgi:glycopeptide antibiotics resistance protein
MFAFYFQLKYRKVKSYLVLLVCIIIFGTIIEVLQMTVTDYRSFDVYDILANSIGAMLFFVVYLISKRFFSRFEA